MSSTSPQAAVPPDRLPAPVLAPVGRFRLLQTEAFVEELTARLAGAERRILVQLMTFDGDAAGQRVADLLIDAARRGVDVRLLVDCFVLRFVSDQPVYRSPVRAEAAATRAMYRRLRRRGVGLRFTHPHGPAKLFALARNHKKLFVIDDDAYLGGINVSDHNFAWHDFMVAIRDERIVTAVIDDFDHSYGGGRRSVNDVIVTNDEIQAVFDRLVLGARHSVVLASPYALDAGLPGLMRRSGASVKTVITTRRNNFLLYRAMSPFLRWRLRRARTTVASYGRFSHSKFLLVDDARLLIGSSNFGRHSFWCNQEIGLLIEDAEFIRHFKAELLHDVTPLDGHLPAIKVAFGALVSYCMYGCLLGLRLTVARCVPSLSRR